MGLPLMDLAGKGYSSTSGVSSWLIFSLPGGVAPAPALPAFSPERVDPLSTSALPQRLLMGSSLPKQDPRRPGCPGRLGRQEVSLAGVD